MTARNVDAEYAFDDPDEGWFGAERPAPASEPAPSPSPPSSFRWDEHPSPPIEPRETFEPDSTEDTDRWSVQDVDLAGPVELEEPQPVPVVPAAESVFSPHLSTPHLNTAINVVPTRRNGFVRASAPSSWESRLSNSGAWEFRTAPGDPWYRSRAVIPAVVIIVGAIAIVGIVMALRGPAGNESTPSESVAPPATSVPSTSGSAASSVAPLPPPPPGLPPPPPLTAEELNPPAPRQYWPGYQTPDPPKKPQTNVTRSPLSATPPPPPRETNRGRATPGQSGSHGMFG